tara:strand:- start:7856 stop:8542 length:687 start_codon:yes stop_codon:yes gene_type:complete
MNLQQLAEQFPYNPQAAKYNNALVKLAAAATIEFGAAVGFFVEPEATDVFFLSTMATILGAGVAGLGLHEIISDINRTRKTNSITFYEDNAIFQRGLSTYVKYIHQVDSEETLNHIIENNYQPYVLIPTNITDVHRPKIKDRKRGPISWIKGNLNKTIINAHPTKRTRQEITNQYGYLGRPGSNIFEPAVQLSLLGKIIGWNEPDIRYDLTEISIEMELEGVYSNEKT